MRTTACNEWIEERSSSKVAVETTRRDERFHLLHSNLADE